MWTHLDQIAAGSSVPRILQAVLSSQVHLGTSVCSVTTRLQTQLLGVTILPSSLLPLCLGSTDTPVCGQSTCWSRRLSHALVLPSYLLPFSFSFIAPPRRRNRGRPTSPWALAWCAAHGEHWLLPAHQHEGFLLRFHNFNIKNIFFYFCVCHLMASTCREHKKSMILTVPVDVFIEFLNVYLYSHYTTYSVKMKRETLCTCRLRKQYEHQVWEEMCVSRSQRHNIGVDHQC